MHGFNASFDQHAFTKEVYINEKNELWEIKAEKSNFLYMPLLPHGFMPGEPFYILLEFNDEEKTYLLDYGIPVLLEAFGENGRHVFLEIFQGNQKAQYYIKGESFQPNEEIFLTTLSGYTAFTKSFHATTNGSFNILVNRALQKDKNVDKEAFYISSQEQKTPIVLIEDFKGFEE